MSSNKNFENYVPGSALASVDAKIAELDAQFKRMMDTALKVALAHEQMPEPKPPEESPLKTPTVECIAVHLRTCKNVIVLCGAGISTSAGIPDFRTPGTGLYDNIQKYLDKYNVQTPQDLFGYQMFLQNPKPFYELAKDIKYPPASIKPTIAHHFLKLLHDKGVLLRVYTQNIDMLESEIGLPDSKLFEVHGSFRSGTCLECGTTFNKQWIKEGIYSKAVPLCDKPMCDGVVKPDIVFFGESLPQDYLCKSSMDCEKCDLLIIMGTSLSVGPVNRLPTQIPNSAPRLLINREKVCVDVDANKMMAAPLFFFDHPANTRDVYMGNDIDQDVQTLVKLAGWETDLKILTGEMAAKQLYVSNSKAKAVTNNKNTKYRS